MHWTVGRVKITKIVELETTGHTRFILPQATKEEIQKFCETATIPPNFESPKEYELTLRSWVGKYQNMTNYRYWYAKCYSEQQKNTMDAHKDLYDALVAFPTGNTSEAARLAYEGLTKYEKILEDAVAKNTLQDDDLAIEEIMLGILTWRKALELENRQIPNEFPLRSVWLQHQARLKQIEQEFNRQISPQRN